MNEFDYENMQKKRIARGAYARRNGSKSKKCSLPSDTLTPAQLKKLSGPVSEYAIHAPMSWEMFCAMPKDLQQEHLTFIQDKFHIGGASISTEVFGLKSKSTMHAYAKRNGLVLNAFAGRVSAATYRALDEWMNRTYDDPEPAAHCEAAIQSEETKDDQHRTDDSDLIRDALCGASICLEGPVSEIVPAIIQIVGRYDADIAVHLTVKKRKDG